MKEDDVDDDDAGDMNDDEVAPLTELMLIVIKSV
jgi:hypothetical protein